MNDTQKPFCPKLETVISQVKQEGIGVQGSPIRLVKKFWDSEGNYIGEIQLGKEKDIVLSNNEFTYGDYSTGKIK